VSAEKWKGKNQVSVFGMQIATRNSNKGSSKKNTETK